MACMFVFRTVFVLERSINSGTNGKLCYGDICVGPIVRFVGARTPGHDGALHQMFRFELKLRHYVESSM